ncbi:hypothetical protein NXY56_003244 [Leishmania guyanensis]
MYEIASCVKYDPRKEGVGMEFLIQCPGANEPFRLWDMRAPHPFTRINEKCSPLERPASSSSALASSTLPKTSQGVFVGGAATSAAQGWRRPLADPAAAV